MMLPLLAVAEVVAAAVAVAGGRTPVGVLRGGVTAGEAVSAATVGVGP